MPDSVSPQIDRLLATSSGRQAVQNLVNLDKLGDTLDRVFALDAEGARRDQKSYGSRVDLVISNEKRHQKTALYSGLGSGFVSVACVIRATTDGILATTSTNPYQVSSVFGVASDLLAAMSTGIVAGQMNEQFQRSKRSLNLATQYAGLSEQTRASLVLAGESGSVYEPQGLETYLQVVHENLREINSALVPSQGLGADR